jgi:hypothetical protein
MIGKITLIVKKVTKTVANPKKCQNIYIEAQFEHPKHLHGTKIETQKWQQQTTY